MNYSIRDYEEYLLNNYKEFGVDTSLFMKLVEEIGEVAEVLNKRDGRKVNDSDDIQAQLAYELVDVIHYATAIAALNGIDISSLIIEKDRKASMKYHHDKNMESFLAQKNADKDEVYQFMKYE